MTTQTASASRDAVLWAARQTVRMHAERSSRDRATGCCKRCCPGRGCPLLGWALSIVRAHEQPSGLL